MNCPVCTKLLIVVEYKNIELDYCLFCKGFWFDADELKMLSSALQINTEIPDIFSFPTSRSQEKKRKCPRCNKKMDKVELGLSPGILVDRCKNGDGLWLDQGELGQLMEQHLQDKLHGETEIVKFLGETFAK